MRLLYLFTLLIFYSISLQGQLLLDNCVWINERSDANPSNMHIDYTYIKYCTGMDDTIISSKTYRKLYNCSDRSYLGGLRNGQEKVFFIPKDSLSESLAYDFTVDVGDTIRDYYVSTYMANWPLVVTKLDTIVIDGQPKRTVEFNQFGRWIEDIGSSSGLFAEVVSNINGYGLQLLCFSTLDTIKYPSWQSSPCQLNLDLAIENAGPKIEVFPNPAHTTLQISLGTLRTVEIKLLALNGATVLSQRITDLTSEIDISWLSPGLYFLKLTSEEQNETMKLIKAE